MNAWDLAYLSASPVVGAGLLYKRLRHGKNRQSLPGSFGANLPKTPLLAMKHRVWLHSVSVGETVAAGALFRLLKERHGDWEYLSTTTTETGQEQSRKSLAAATWRDFAPVDFSWKVRNFVSAYNPSVYLLLETELWPNALLECRRRGVKVFLVNGKLSERSGARYERFKSLLRAPLSAFTAMLMQTEADADRMARIAPAGTRIEVTGNVKFDGLPAPLTSEGRQHFRTRWEVSSTALVVLAGSTHPGEERLIHAAFAKLREQNPSARLVIAPRHPERFDSVAEELRKLGEVVHRSSSPREGSVEPTVTLLDEMGVLASAFGAADIALVGGAWNPIGGHNLLEPAVHGVPVIHGPHMHAQKEIMRIVRDHKASLEAGEQQLADAMLRLASNHVERRALGERGRHAALENAGAAHRSVDLIEEMI